jgi:hypothetical protein
LKAEEARTPERAGCAILSEEKAAASSRLFSAVVFPEVAALAGVLRTGEACFLARFRVGMQALPLGGAASFRRCQFFGAPAVLAFPCFRVGMPALPLCGAAPTFLCRGKEK